MRELIHNPYSWLCDYYDRFLKYDYPLFSKKASVENAICVKFYDNGNFKITDYQCDKMKKVLIPVTIESLNRTSGIASHPVVDVVKRIFHDGHSENYLSNLHMYNELMEDENTIALEDFLKSHFDELYLELKTKYSSTKDFDKITILWEYGDAKSGNGELFDDKKSNVKWAEKYYAKYSSECKFGDCMVTGHKNVSLLKDGTCPMFGVLKKTYTSNKDDDKYGFGKMNSDKYGTSIVSYGVIEAFKVATSLDFLVCNRSNKIKTNCLDIGESKWLVVFPEVVENEEMFEEAFSDLRTLVEFNSGSNGNKANELINSIQKPKFESNEIVNEANDLGLKLYALVVSNTHDGYHTIIESSFEIDSSNLVKNIDEFKKNFTSNNEFVYPSPLFKMKGTNFKLEFNKSIMFGKKICSTIAPELIKLLRKCDAYDNEFMNNMKLLDAINNYNEFRMKEVM